MLECQKGFEAFVCWETTENVWENELKLTTEGAGDAYVAGAA